MNAQTTPAGASNDATEKRRAFFTALAPVRARDARRHSVYYRDRVRWLSHLIPSDASVLDIGCGIGTILRALPQKHKTGIDFSPAMIAEAKAGDPASTYIEDDVEHLHHRGSYDYVLLLDAIHFVRDVEQSLRMIRTHLCHPRTRLVITHYNFLWQPLFLIAEAIGWKTKFPEQNWLGRSDIGNLLDLCGFEIVETSERVLFPLRLPLIEPFCNRFLASLPVFRSLCLVKTIVARPVGFPAITPTVTILSAVRNERGNIPKIVESMPVMGAGTELLFIEGHSSDGTFEEIERAVSAQRGGVTIRGLRQPGKGKGDALHFGMTQATGDIIIVYDGDFTVHPSELPKLVEVLATGKAEYLNGSRLVYPLEKGAMRFLNLLGNKFFSVLFSWLCKQKMTDTLTPVKAFFRSDYARMTLRMDPFGDFDIFFGASMQQRKMREVPMHYLERTYGTTKMRPFRHAALLLRMFFFGARRLRWI